MAPSDADLKDLIEAIAYSLSKGHGGVSVDFVDISKIMGITNVFKVYASVDKLRISFRLSKRAFINKKGVDRIRYWQGKVRKATEKALLL